MADIYTYKVDKNVKDTYINLTNQCTNDCLFCLRREHDGVAGHNLRLKQEPDAQQVIGALKEEQPDIVFCGLGEPTIKIEELKEIARYVKSYGGYVRINTNGHASVYHKRDIAKELVGLVDEVSISLNASDAHEYSKITKCRYGEDGYSAMLDFARNCVENGIKVTLSVVDVIEPEETERCRAVAQGVGAEFRVRHYV